MVNDTNQTFFVYCKRPRNGKDVVVEVGSKNIIHIPEGVESLEVAEVIFGGALEGW